jgi:hypothetical protein
MQNTYRRRLMDRASEGVMLGELAPCDVQLVKGTQRTRP